MNSKLNVKIWWLVFTTMFIFCSGVILSDLHAQVATIGTGTDINTTTGPAPINIYFRSIRTQTVYTVGELNDAGMIGASNISDLAYYIESPPIHALPNFRIRIRHTTATDASQHIEGPYEEVYQVDSYLPVAGDWEVLTFSLPFAWNGIDNILIDTTFDMVPSWNSSGQQRIFDSPDGMRFVRSDSSDQGDTTTTMTNDYKPQVQLHYVPADTYDDDMAAFAISGPPNLSPGTEGTFSVSVINMGSNTQNNYTIRLMTDDDTELASVTGTETLEQFETAVFDLHWTPTFDDEGLVTLWGEVDLTGDENPDNDASPSIDVVIAESLSGTYSINHDGTGDFSSLSEVLNTLTLVGVDGPAVFEIAPGTYTEQVEITDIMGASATNTVTFTGAGDDPEDVVLTYENMDTNNRHIIKLDGAKHLRFSNLTFNIGADASHGFVFHIQNQSEDIEITNNILNNIVTSSSNFVSIVASNSNFWSGAGNTVHDILIADNIFNDGYAAIRLNGETANRLTGVEIRDNVIDQTYYHGIYLTNTFAAVIKGNSIDGRPEDPVTAFGGGIWLSHAHGPFEIAGNRITNTGQYGIYMSNGQTSPDDRSVIANNMLGGGFRNTGSFGGGIRILGTVDNLNIYYNSVNLDFGDGAGLNIRVTGVTGLDIRNNSFVYTGGGTGNAMYVSSTGTPDILDYNNYYSNGSNFVYYGTELADLNALQNVNIPPENDEESLETDPLYVDAFDLDLQSASELIGAGVSVPGVLDDFHGNPRHPEFPTIGAHEFDVSGFGALDGYVYDQADNQPLNGVLVEIQGTNYNALTDDDGYFIMPFVFQGTYSVTASLFGYHSETIENVLIEEDETASLTFTIEQLTNVTVSGQVVGSDYPTIGLPDAQISFTGYEDYYTETDANGNFSIPGVYIAQTYTLTIYVENYSLYMEEIDVGDTDLDLGVLIVEEIAYPPHSVEATQADDESQVDLIWNSPLAVDYYFYDFEDGDQGWTTGAISGTDHWELGTPAQSNINSAHSGDYAWMTYLTQDYDNNANTWLMTPELNLSGYNEVYFSAYLNIWCENNWDGMVLESSTDGGNTWNHVRSDDTNLEFYNNSSTSGPLDPPKWSGRTAGTHGIWTEVTTELPELENESSVYFRFRFATDGSVTDEGIAVDDVYIGSQPPDRSRAIVYDSRSDRQRVILSSLHSSADQRVLENYDIYRFIEDDMENEDNWDFLASVTDTTYTDLTWPDAPSGYYYYAVKAVYTNDVFSEPAISNMVERDVFVTVSGQVVGSDFPAVGLEGVPVSLTGEHNYSVETDEDGYFTIPLVYMFHTYTLIINAEGYSPYAEEIEVIDQDIDLGVIIVDEVAYPPYDVVATQADDESQVDLIWNSPLAIDYFFTDFEDDDGGFLSSGPVNDWEWGVPTDPGGPPAAYSGQNVWATNLSDEFSALSDSRLDTPSIFIPAGADFVLEYYQFYDFGPPSWDGGNLKISIDDGATWEIIHPETPYPTDEISSGAAGVGGEPGYVGILTDWELARFNLNDYAGNEVIIRWHFGSTSVAHHPGWFIDDVYIGPDTDLPGRAADRYAETSDRASLENTGHLLRSGTTMLRSDVPRVLESYNVYRLTTDDLDNEDNWDFLASITDTTYTDLTWPDAPSGYYYFAVKAVYTNDVLSDPAISNLVERDVFVTVSGQVTGSDYPAVGLEGVPVSLTGVDDYYVETDENGMFTIPLVYMFNTYDLVITAEGYAPYTDEIVVEEDDLDLGVIVVDEIAYPPANVIATQSADDTYVDLVWNVPEPIEYYFYDFEDGEEGWTTGAITGNDQWELGTPAQTQINNAYSGVNAWMTGLTQNYDNSANSWLMSPELDLSHYNEVYFSVFLNIWSEGGWDGMILESSTDGGNTWNHVRSDDTDLAFYNNNSTSGPIDPPKWSGRTMGVHGFWDEFAAEIPEIAGENSVYLRFRFGSDSIINGEGIAVDDVYIGPEPPERRTGIAANPQGLLRSSEANLRSNYERAIEGYKVYRFLYEDIDNEDNWVELATVTDTTYTDTAWENVAAGFYRYAVKAEYTNEIYSDPAISNWVGKDMTTNVTVNITIDVGDSAEGATVNLYYQEQDPDGQSPVFTATAVGEDPSVATLLNVLRGVYDIEVYKPGYTTYTQANVDIQTPTEFDVELEEIPYPPENLTFTAGNNIVSLSWDAPDPTVREANAPSYSEIFAGLRERGITDKEEMERKIREIMDSYDNADNPFSIRPGRRSRETVRNRELLGYNVYRDGVQINTDPVEVTTYNDTTVENNVTYIFYVTAVYSMSESDPSNSVTVVPGPNQLINIGEDTTTANSLPLNFFWRNSLSQTIYMADEINMAGLITQIRYYSNFVTDLPDMPVKLWIGETDDSDLSDGWIASTELDLVFDDTVDFPAGENTITIDLDDFYFYTGTENLVILANRPMDTTYYSSGDHFYYSITPDYSNRSRNMQSDSIEYDPANPTGGTLTNRVPNTGLYFVTVGMGSLDGYVYYEDDQPVEGAEITVADTDFVAHTNSQGYYLFPYMFEGTHTVTASKFGYYDDVAEDVLVEEYENTTVNFTLSPLPTVTVSGRVVGSDQPDIGLDDAFISLDGYDYYETYGDAGGLFQLTEVYADQTYTMTVQRSGYSTLTQEVEVGDTDLDLGDVVVNELAFPPFDVTAEISDDNMEAYIDWISPDAYDLIEFRYDDGVPTTAIGLPDGTNNSVLGAVHRRSAILNSVSWYLSGTTNYPTVNLFIFGLDNDGLPNSNIVLYHETDIPNNHQQWTSYELPEDIDAPNGFLIGLSVEGNLGLAADNGTGEPYEFENNTHYYTSNYTTGTWATMESAGYSNNFLLRAHGFDLGPIRISGSLISTAPFTVTGSTPEAVELSGQLSSPEIGRGLSEQRAEQRSDRVLIEFIIYRLEQGQEQEPDQWDELGTVDVDETSFVDTELSELLNGTYRYAVRSVYTNNVLSMAALSNTIEYEEDIPFITNLEASVDGNNVHLSWEWVNGRNSAKDMRLSSSRPQDAASRRSSPEDRAFLGFTITRNADQIVQNVMETHYIDEGLEPGQYTYTVIGIFTNGSTNMLNVQAVVTVDVDDEVSLEPLTTALLGNHPNPFNPDTTIRYSLESDGKVTIEVFNVRGQLVKVLVDEYQTAGKYSVIWDGKDVRGRDAGSGIFFYRMKSGTYTSTRKMIMIK